MIKIKNLLSKHKMVAYLKEFGICYTIKKNQTIYNISNELLNDVATSHNWFGELDDDGDEYLRFQIWGGESCRQQHSLDQNCQAFQLQ